MACHKVLLLLRASPVQTACGSEKSFGERIELLSFTEVWFRVKPNSNFSRLSGELARSQILPVRREIWCLEVARKWPKAGVTRLLSSSTSRIFRQSTSVCSSRTGDYAVRCKRPPATTWRCCLVPCSCVRRSVGLALLLLGISVYVFAIAFRMTLDGTPIGMDKFANCAIAMHTLIVHGTFLDAVSDIMEALLTDSIPGFILMCPRDTIFEPAVLYSCPTAWASCLLADRQTQRIYAFMYAFVTLSAVTIMNMLIGILCEVITAVADAEREALQVSYSSEVIQECISASDNNNDGCIDLNEFHGMLQLPQVRKVLHEVDVDVQTLVNFADVLFEDDNGITQQKLPFGDFMQKLLQLRGKNTATVKDLVDLRKWISREMKEQNRKLRARESGEHVPPENGEPQELRQKSEELAPAPPTRAIASSGYWRLWSPDSSGRRRGTGGPTARRGEQPPPHVQKMALPSSLARFHEGLPPDSATGVLPQHRLRLVFASLRGDVRTDPRPPE
eukprot:s3792_g5.t1